MLLTTTPQDTAPRVWLAGLPAPVPQLLRQRSDLTELHPGEVTEI